MFWNKKEENIEEHKEILMLDLNEVLEVIKIWNKATFPEATLAGQLAKLEEEIKEFTDAKDNEAHAQELADIFIVLGGLRRFESLIGNMQEKFLTKEMPVAVLAKLIVSIIQKMEINMKRTWEKDSEGKYHHKEPKTPKKGKKK